MDRTPNSIYCSSITFNPLTSGSIATSSGYAGSQTEDTDPDFLPSFNDLSLGKSGHQSSIIASSMTGSSNQTQVQSPWVSPQTVSDKFDTAQKISMANYASSYGYNNSISGPTPTHYSSLYPVQRSLSNSGVTETGDSYEAGSAFGIHRPRAESFTGNTRGRFKSVSSDTTYDLLKKRDPRIGFNAQSCTPNFDKEAPQQAISGGTQKISSYYAPTARAANIPTGPAGKAAKLAPEPSPQETYQAEMGKSVAEKLRQYKINKVSVQKVDYKDGPSVQMPQKYHQLFRDLTKTLNERTTELEETKARLEAVVVGLLMSKGTDITENGTVDAEEMAHRITSKLSALSAENEALQRMVSYSNKQSLLVELNLLREENDSMKKSLEELKKA